jgi:hypothetical protein
MPASRPPGEAWAAAPDRFTASSGVARAGRQSVALRSQVAGLRTAGSIAVVGALGSPSARPGVAARADDEACGARGSTSPAVDGEATSFLQSGLVPADGALAGGSPDA